MPSGTGSAVAVNDPRLPTNVVMNPEAFFQRTERRVRSPLRNVSAGLAGADLEPRRLPASGIIGKLVVQFAGTLTVTVGAGSVTTGPRWPYGLLDAYQLQADQRADVFRWDGLQAHALRAVRHPASIINSADVIPGGVGAGNAITTGANNIAITWEIPIAIDDALLIGSLFAQSDSVTLTQLLRQAIAADLLVAAGGATIDSLTGTFTTQVESFTLPTVQSNEGRVSMVAPDISMYHSVQAKSQAFANTGEIAIPITRGAGQLSRVLIQAKSSTDRGVTTDPYLVTTPGVAGIDSISLRYGAGSEPLVYDPADLLTQANHRHYGQSLPYGYVALDFLAENPVRDVINMPGVTDLEVVVGINAGVAPAAEASVQVVAEMLLQGQGA